MARVGCGGCGEHPTVRCGEHEFLPVLALALLSRAFSHMSYTRGSAQRPWRPLIRVARRATADVATAGGSSRVGRLSSHRGGGGGCASAEVSAPATYFPLFPQPPAPSFLPIRLFFYVGLRERVVSACRAYQVSPGSLGKFFFPREAFFGRRGSCGYSFSSSPSSCAVFFSFQV